MPEITCKCGKVFHVIPYRVKTAKYCSMNCPSRRKQTSQEEFLSKVYPEPNTGCWLWSGAYHYIGGHGSINAKNHNGFAWAHRFSYFIHKGDFDRTKLICHTCDNPACVNPDHLYIGTTKTNSDDKVSRNRQMRGEKYPLSKLKESDIISIRSLNNSGIQQKDICKEFGLSSAMVSLIVNRKRWAHI